MSERASEPSDRGKPATVRFYVDADLLGLGKLLTTVRSDVTYPGDPGGVVFKRRRPPCPITRPAVLDVNWLPFVARQGWLIITRDRHIQSHTKELDAVRDNGARMVALSGEQAVTKFDQLEVVMCQWRQIEALAPQAGPFVYRAERTRLSQIALR